MDELDGYFLGEYEICIKSWHTDFYNKNFKTADSFSDYRYHKQFTDKQEANKAWLWIKNAQPTYEQLEKAGFTKTIW